MLTFGSLFSGIGGFDRGFELSGMQCAWQVEWDEKAQGVLATHWPDVARYGDVRDVGRHNLGAVDVITGGFPCQDVSVAGKRAGLAGERSGLWFEFHRILEELRPGWVVIENVPGLLSSNKGRDFATILRGLVELGYGVAWRILDAQYFGVAQRRRRVFIVGHLGDGRAATILDYPNSDIPQALAGGMVPCVVGTLKAAGVHTMSGVGYVATEQGIRTLTPRECERLQGFPDGHTADQSDTARYRQLGNAVCVNVAEWIGQRICDADMSRIPLCTCAVLGGAPLIRDSSRLGHRYGGGRTTDQEEE